MSTAKRSRRRHADARATSPLPASKRIKTTKTSHVPARQGLDFLVDEDARAGRRLDAKLTNGVPSSRATRVDESRAAVAPDVRDQNEVSALGDSQKDAIDISSAEEDSDDEESDEEDIAAVAERVNGTAEQMPKLNGHSAVVDEDGEEQAVMGAEDVDMVDQEGEEAGEAEEPSFGDLLQARHPEPIDVHASFSDPLAKALIPTTGDRTLSAPSGTTLRTVLTQALKTNDKDMLERCFQTTDLNDIRLTIERLQSQHVASLLQRLAERIHKRPGRTGNLIVWVQWSLVAHGAYLASQPEVMKKLRSLSQVLRERANGLQPLLRLKGKLDMLQAQLELRQRMQAASRAANAEDDEDDEDVIYVEGQDDDWTDGEGAVEVDGALNALEAPPLKSKGHTARSDIDDTDDESDSGDDMPNGVHQEAEDESSEEDEDAEEGLFDLEAEESSDENDDDIDSDNESESHAESDDDAELSENDDDESDTAVKQPNPTTLTRKR